MSELFGKEIHLEMKLVHVGRRAGTNFLEQRSFQFTKPQTGRGCRGGGGGYKEKTQYPK